MSQAPLGFCVAILEVKLETMAFPFLGTQGYVLSIAVISGFSFTLLSL